MRYRVLESIEERVMLEQIRKDLTVALEELYAASRVEDGGILVVGCSTSEVLGKKIGTAGSEDAARAIWETISGFCSAHVLFVAAQCCEHLNRSLVVEKSLMKARGLTQVNAIPRREAGGAFATAAYAGMREPVLVERIVADIGLDIGGTLIGMHLRPVVVPVRVSVSRIGEAPLILARSRCPYVGGERARYDPALS
jgi:uncharacterized protein (TIGR01440 family)